MNVKAQVYKIKKSFIKNANSIGFFGGADEEGKEEVYARAICLDLDTPIMKRTIKMFESFYASANEADKKADFADFKFDKDGKLKAEPNLGECMLCVTIKTNNKDNPRNILFLNAPDGRQYYNIDILNTHCSEIIHELLKKNYIELKTL